MRTAPLLSLLALLPLAARAQDPMQMPRPGPEHQLLARDVGVWDATVEMMPAGGAAPQVSKGTETSRMLGGFWLVSDFESEMMGQPFRGLGTTGYDPAKKKYVGTWVDSMSAVLSTSEARYDPKTRTMTGYMESLDEKGKKARFKETTQWKEDGSRVFTMYSPAGKDGKERAVMRITYVRRGEQPAQAPAQPPGQAPTQPPTSR
jgi:hypothetical protein